MLNWDKPNVTGNVQVESTFVTLQRREVERLYHTEFLYRQALKSFRELVEEHKADRNEYYTKLREIGWNEDIEPLVFSSEGKDVWFEAKCKQFEEDFKASQSHRFGMNWIQLRLVQFLFRKDRRFKDYLNGTY